MTSLGDVPWRHLPGIIWPPSAGHHENLGTSRNDTTHNTALCCRSWFSNPTRRLQTIHGYFTAVGQIDRPFIYTVSPLSASRTFSTYTVTAHQPAAQSANPSGDPFPASDAAASPAGPPCFTAITSFKQPEPHSGGASVAEEPAQSRFSQLLASRPARDWPPAPPIDIDGVVAMAGADVVGTFPVVDMRKVDMAAHNDGRPLHERRELLLYRLLKPLPADGTDGWDANAHVLVHAFEADRNGLLMLGNHLGFGFRFGRAASLSYSFVVHVNVEEAVMRYEDPRWWVQEVSFPRASAGRGVVMSKIWSPDGVHVATEYQDGLCRTISDGKGEARAQKL